jgi:hypothetical protein
MEIKFDDVDAEILKQRQAEFDAVPGPRVGDFLRVGEDFLRFTHDWDDSLQTTVPHLSSAYSASFYLGEKGYVSFSGSLDPPIDKTRLQYTGETKDGAFWFFHHGWQGAHRGVQCSIPCRVFVRVKTMQDWHDAHVDLGKFLKIGDPVSEDMADYFLGVLPPATWLSNLIQIGEPHSHVRGRATFATIHKRGPVWYWAGNCWRGENTEPIPTAPQSLYEELAATGAYLSNHESDLYVEVTEQTTAILSRYPTSKANATIFRNNVTEKPCYDIPFAYLPWFFGNGMEK